MLEDVVRDLHRADEVFSTYRPDSQVSRLGRGEVPLEDCDPEVAEVLELGRRAEQLSGGAFSIHGGGQLDPSAVVKAGRGAGGGSCTSVDGAVATSGTAERGAHVWNPATGRAATGLAGLTLVGPDLASADALSTAGFVLGDAGRDWLESLGPEYGTFAVRPDGTTWETAGFARWGEQ